jgi:ATP-binding cassette subfamily B (MDR/TAP) protein 1
LTCCRNSNEWLKAFSINLLFVPEVSCWTLAGERQSVRIRTLYLEAVLKQDVSFFDAEMTSGEAISRMSTDTVLVQDALGEKVTNAFDNTEKQTT